MNYISDEMLEQYHDQGYVVVPDLIEQNHLDTWVNRLSDIVEKRVDAGNERRDGC